jgi:vitamin B12 transporter
MGGRPRCLCAAAIRRSNKVLVDGVSAGDLGGGFDFGPLSTTAVEGPRSIAGPIRSLYGADAEAAW